MPKRSFALLLSLFALPACASVHDLSGFVRGTPPVRVVGFRNVWVRHGQLPVHFAELAIDVFRSQAFRQRVLALHMEELWPDRDPALPPTPEALVERVMSAGEGGFGIQCHDRRTCEFSHRTHGWDGVEGEVPRWISLNCRHVTTRQDYRWAGTIVHELTHVAGFHHSHDPGDNSRDTSNYNAVPYVLGDIAEWTAAEMAAGPGWNPRGWHPESDPSPAFCTVWRAAYRDIECPHGG